jgi:predicted nucleic acid-binding protein
LAIDVDVAEEWGRLLAAKDKAKNDAAIAATAKRHNFTVVTRNKKDFAGRGVRLLDPYTERPTITDPD